MSAYMACCVASRLSVYKFFLLAYKKITCFSFLLSPKIEAFYLYSIVYTQ